MALRVEGFRVSSVSWSFVMAFNLRAMASNLLPTSTLDSKPNPRDQVSRCLETILDACESDQRFDSFYINPKAASYMFFV